MSYHLSHLSLLSDRKIDLAMRDRANDETVQIALVAEVIRRVAEAPPRARLLDAPILILAAIGAGLAGVAAWLGISVWAKRDHVET